LREAAGRRRWRGSAEYATGAAIASALQRRAALSLR